MRATSYGLDCLGQRWPRRNVVVGDHKLQQQKQEMSRHCGRSTAQWDPSRHCTWQSGVWAVQRGESATLRLEATWSLSSQAWEISARDSVHASSYVTTHWPCAAECVHSKIYPASRPDSGESSPPKTTARLRLLDSRTTDLHPGAVDMQHEVR